MADSRESRCRRARLALEGLSIGDAFGDCFFAPSEKIEPMLASRTPPPPVWRYTDDTLMSASVFAQLQQDGEIKQDALAADFVRRYEMDRGYGPSLQGLLAALRDGGDWRVLAPAQFEGQGSYGNGAAMRSAPIGAYFTDDLPAAIAQTTLASVVTHAHPEAIAGAIAVAIAAALAGARSAQERENGGLAGADFLKAVAEQTPQSQVRARLIRAAGMQDASVTLAVTALGNGVRLSAPDTVPFALWCASKNLTHYEDALYLAVSGLGDRDTICAIVGGIVALSAGETAIPAAWRAAREPLPTWTTPSLPIDSALLP